MLHAGTESQCNHAIDYIDFIKQQRVGPVTIDTERSRGDYTAYTVPGDCIGFVMGRNGQTLRSMEEEWGVLMFFAKTEGSQRGDDEQLCMLLVMLGCVLWMHLGGGLGPARHRSPQHAP